MKKLMLMLVVMMSVGCATSPEYKPETAVLVSISKYVCDCRGGVKSLYKDKYSAKSILVCWNGDTFVDMLIKDTSTKSLSACKRDY